MEIKLTKVRIKNCNCILNKKEDLERLRKNLKKFFNSDDILFDYDEINNPD